MAHIIDDNEMEIEEFDSFESEHSENSDDSQNLGMVEIDILEFVKDAIKRFDAATIVKVINFAAHELSTMEHGVRKVARPQTTGQEKARAWEQWVFARCNKEGWAPFVHKNKAGVETHYAGAAQTPDGKMVFLDSAKPFTQKHAKIYASQVRNTDWYAEFEASYVPSGAPPKPKPSAEEKEAEKARKKAEKEAEKAAEKARKDAEKAAARERKLAEKAAEKAAAEEKKKEEFAKLKAVVPSVVPKLKVAAAAAPAVAVAAAPKPVVTKIVAPAAPAKKVTWVKPADGNIKLFEIGGKSYWRDAEDYLFENQNGEPAAFAGQFLNGKIDDSVENPFADE